MGFNLLQLIFKIQTMKKIVLFSIVSLLSSNFYYSQIATNQTPVATITDENAFLDASSNFDQSANSSNTVGKGLVYPRTNLTTWVFKTDIVDGINFPTGFDGMVVYNTGTGNTLTGTNNPSVASAVTPGFYYFSNPIVAGSATGSAAVTNGRWLPLGAASAKFNAVNNAAAGVATNTLVDGNQVYAYKGQFTTTGSSTAVTLAVPTGLTSMYGITIFKKASTGNKVVFSKELYSYDSSTGAAITGSQSMSVVYPADTYDYIIEYFK
ncbi:hypothetical protein DD829_05380 [Chryseobacterium sp. HMWF035]|nr:hypothetical protein DBR25_11930 [Chryseobacterium sp. HMWF001]PVV59956.1 hypothetical protein DD829_05380 [Chryseobacterium sp. HMWF035]